MPCHLFESVQQAAQRLDFAAVEPTVTAVGHTQTNIVVDVSYHGASRATEQEHDIGAFGVLQVRSNRNRQWGTILRRTLDQVIAVVQTNEQRIAFLAGPEHRSHSSWCQYPNVT